MTTPSISISKTINSKLDTSIIPILITHLKKESLFKYVSRYIHIPDKYIPLLDQIEDNMKNKGLHMSSFTIEYKPLEKKNKKELVKSSHNKIHTKKTREHGQSKSHGHTQKHSSKIHQLFIIAINNNSHSKEHYDELLEAARVSGNAIFNTLKSNQIKQVNIVDTIDQSSDLYDMNDMNNMKNKDGNNIVSGRIKFIEAMVEGLLLSSYKFLKYKTSHSLTKGKDNYTLQNLNIVLPEYYKAIQESTIHNRIKYLQNQIKSVFLARDLINEPANTMKATTFIDIVKKYISDNNIPVSIEILDKHDLEKQGMGLILAVGQGSSTENAPRVVIIKYEGSMKGGGSVKGSGSVKREKPEYILLGKGITFDTGGLDIKGSRTMIEMKTDLSGAATVISFLLGYAMNSGSKSIYTICPFAENSVGPESIKPSDVVKSYNGMSVEIANTDAEGRLVLADCLAYAVDKYPEAILIDFATLTGQQESVSCKMFSNVLSVNSNDEVAKLIESGKEINEQLVELPIVEKQLKNLESYVADIKNVSFSCSADIIMSSLFMRQFVKKDSKWIHIDIAGPSYKVNEIIKYASPEASGVGVRLLFQYFA